jgi:dihydroneopterin triphosphate diphosphatase
MKQRISIRATGVVVYVMRRRKEDVQFLLLLRTPDRGGFWQTVSGGLERGETAWQTALREVHEETGLMVTELFATDQVECYYQHQKDRIYMAPAFVAFVPDKLEVKISHEHTEFRWANLKETLELLPFDQQRCIAEYVDREFLQRKPHDRLRILPEL